jgi:murein DD-endopeptidase MepM/ murein hydrolase activator NlpD
MYGHMESKLAVESGPVRRGQLIGTIFRRTDGIAPSHLHFELRNFYTTTEVNGEAPRYPLNCGYQCPPGPGYWPISAPELPSAMGWFNPIHAISRRAYAGDVPTDAEVVVATGAGASASLWTEPADRSNAVQIDDVPLNPGDRYRLLATATGPDATQQTSAEGYRLWYRIETPGSGRGWVQAAIPLPMETGSDGRACSIRFDFLPVVFPQ